MSRPNPALRLYPELRFGGFTRVDGTVAFYARVRSLVAATDLVIDAGCGRGEWGEDRLPFRRDLRLLRGRCARVIGLDVSDAGAANPFVDEFRRIDGIRWPVEDGVAGAIVADYVLEHVPDPGSFLAECRRALRPGGHLCIRTPNRASWFGVATLLVPERLSGRVLRAAQPSRADKDAFPRYYRCNTAGRLRRALARGGFDPCVLTHEGEPAYFASWPALYSAAARLLPLVPRPFRSNLFAFGRRLP